MPHCPQKRPTPSTCPRFNHSVSSRRPCPTVVPLLLLLALLFALTAIAPSSALAQTADQDSPATPAGQQAASPDEASPAKAVEPANVASEARQLSLTQPLSGPPLVLFREDNPLKPIKTDHPRDTFRSYLEAIEAYRLSIEAGKPDETRLHDAVRCFDLSLLPIINRQQLGREAAILLKEILDRIIIIDLDKIPATTTEPSGEPLNRWRLKGTEITITRVSEGERTGEYLFSPETTLRLPLFFEKVKNLDYLPGTTGGAGFREPWIQRILPRWASQKVLDVTYGQWLGLFVAILIGLTMRQVVSFLGTLVLRLTDMTSTDWDRRIVQAVVAPVALLAATGIWQFALIILHFQGPALTVLSVIIKALFIASLIWIFYRLAEISTEFMKYRYKRSGSSRLDAQLVELLSRSLKIFVIIFGVLLGAQHMGIQVFSLLAGLGIGGLAIALAAKDTLANFFGSIMIMLDRPFRVGHWIVVGSSEGTVEDIGFRTTRIRTFYNSLISIPNSELVVTPIDNMGLREYRRIKTMIGITYDTPAEKIEAFLEGIKQIILVNPYTRKDYFHVVLNQFGASSLDIMLYAFVKVENWSEELVQRQNIFLEIIRLAQEIGVDFAFPTQSLHIETFPGQEPVRGPHDLDRDRLSSISRSFGQSGENARPGGSGLFIPPHREPVAASPQPQPSPTHKLPRKKK